MSPHYGYDVKGFIDYVTNLKHTSVYSLSACVTWHARAIERQNLTFMG